MPRTSFIAALCALALGGCVHHPRFSKAPDPARPQVIVAPGGYLVVNQEPVMVLRAKGATSVANFQLPSGAGVRFSRDGGIRIIGLIKAVVRGQPQPRLDKPDTSQNGLFNCKTVTDLEVNCVLQPDITAGQYAYEIHAEAADGRRIVLDPTMWIEYPQSP